MERPVEKPIAVSIVFMTGLAGRAGHYIAVTETTVCKDDCFCLLGQQIAITIRVPLTDWQTALTCHQQNERTNERKEACWPGCQFPVRKLKRVADNEVSRRRNIF